MRFLLNLFGNKRIGLLLWDCGYRLRIGDLRLEFVCGLFEGGLSWDRLLIRDWWFLYLDWFFSLENRCGISLIKHSLNPLNRFLNKWRIRLWFIFNYLNQWVFSSDLWRVILFLTHHPLFCFLFLTICLLLNNLRFFFSFVWEFSFLLLSWKLTLRFACLLIFQRFLWRLFFRLLCIWLHLSVRIIDL